MTDLIKTDGRYLHGEDLRRGDTPCEFTLTIKTVGEKDSAKAETGQAIKGYPVGFEQTPKLLVLNGTNTKLAVAALGTNSRTEWIGKRLTLFPSVLAECFGQTNVLCVRVRVPDGVPKPFIMPRHLGQDISQKPKQAERKPPAKPEPQPSPLGDEERFEAANPTTIEEEVKRLEAEGATDDAHF